jgi:isoprenylcysteine carboxyl methyltransferase (ICMT) family protein YpbQ
MWWLLKIPLVALSNKVLSWAYLSPDSFSAHFSQQDLIKFWLTANGLTVALYLAICARAKLNIHGLWMSIPCVILGIAILVMSIRQLGVVRTFFGVELGVVDDAQPIQTFPFSLGHPQYKGAVILLLGIWFAFHHTVPLTFNTGVWIVAFLLQMIVESQPAGRRATT